MLCSFYLTFYLSFFFKLKTFNLALHPPFFFFRLKTFTVKGSNKFSSSNKFTIKGSNIKLQNYPTLKTRKKKIRSNHIFWYVLGYFFFLFNSLLSFMFHKFPFLLRIFFFFLRIFFFTIIVYVFGIKFFYLGM